MFFVKIIHFCWLSIILFEFQCFLLSKNRISLIYRVFATWVHAKLPKNRLFGAFFRNQMSLICRKLALFLFKKTMYNISGGKKREAIFCFLLYLYFLSQITFYDHLWKRLILNVLKQKAKMYSLKNTTKDIIQSNRRLIWNWWILIR